MDQLSITSGLLDLIDAFDLKATLFLFEQNQSFCSRLGTVSVKNTDLPDFFPKNLPILKCQMNFLACQIYRGMPLLQVNKMLHHL